MLQKVKIIKDKNGNDVEITEIIDEKGNVKNIMKTFDENGN